MELQIYLNRVYSNRVFYFSVTFFFMKIKNFVVSSKILVAVTFVKCPVVKILVYNISLTKDLVWNLRQFLKNIPTYK